MEAAARRAEDEARLCDFQIRNADKILAGPLCVQNLPDGTQQHPTTRVKAVQRLLEDFSHYIFTKPAPQIAAEIARAATGHEVNRGQSRNRPSQRRVKDLTFEPAPAD
jgi:hypothetical protein